MDIEDHKIYEEAVRKFAQYTYQGVEYGKKYVIYMIIVFILLFIITFIFLLSIAGPTVRFASKYKVDPSRIGIDDRLMYVYLRMIFPQFITYLVVIFLLSLLVLLYLYRSIKSIHMGLKALGILNKNLIANSIDPYIADSFDKYIRSTYIAKYFLHVVIISTIITIIILTLIYAGYIFQHIMLVDIIISFTILLSSYILLSGYYGALSDIYGASSAWTAFLFYIIFSILDNLGHFFIFNPILGLIGLISIILYLVFFYKAMNEVRRNTYAIKDSILKLLEVYHVSE